MQKIRRKELAVGPEERERPIKVSVVPVVEMKEKKSDTETRFIITFSLDA